jgi:hypothetical protein
MHRRTKGSVVGLCRFGRPDQLSLAGVGGGATRRTCEIARPDRTQPDMESFFLTSGDRTQLETRSHAAFGQATLGCSTLLVLVAIVSHRRTAVDQHACTSGPVPVRAATAPSPPGRDGDGDGDGVDEATHVQTQRSRSLSSTPVPCGPRAQRPDETRLSSRVRVAKRSRSSSPDLAPRTAHPSPSFH